MESLSSESSEETFNSTYLDRVTSNDSGAFLLQSAESSDEEMTDVSNNVQVQEIHLNTAYTTATEESTQHTTTDIEAKQAQETSQASNEVIIKIECENDAINTMPCNIESELNEFIPHHL